MSVIIPSWCRIHLLSLGLVNINTRPCHFIWFCCCSYWSISNQYNVSPSLFDISRQFDVRYNPLVVPYTPHINGLVYINSRPCHIIWSYCCPYRGISIQFTVSPLLFVISRQFNVHYNPLLVPYTAHVTPISQYKHWTLSCYMTLLLLIYRYK
jgi:hypothetical protein